MKKVFCIIIVLISFFSFGQQQDKVDFTKGEAFVKLIPIEKRIKGTMAYEFDILQDVDSVFLDAKNMKINWIYVDAKQSPYFYNNETITIKKAFKKGEKHELIVAYECKPKQALYFIDWAIINYNDIFSSVSTQMKPSLVNSLDSLNVILNKESQIWTQGQGKYTSHWLPSFDDMNEKVEFDLNITYHKEYEVIANGKLTRTKGEGSLKTWFYDMEKPMSSYLLAFAIGNFDKKTAVSSSGIPLEMYYSKKDSLRVEPTYRYTKKIFDFIEDEIGVPYPWQNYKQIPAKDFLYGGMENTGTTIFSDSYVIDSTAFIDKNYVNVNAHELAHQWFGDLVTEVDGNHHWLHEGFATYYALLAEREIFGEDYFYWKLYDTAKQLNEWSKQGKGEALTNPKASSLTFYEKGAWALLMLRERIGTEVFRKGIKSYLLKHQYRNVTISDFITEMEKASGTDLSTYKKLWLQQKEFPYLEALDVLEKSSASISNFLLLKKALTTSKEPNENIIKKYWNNNAGVYLKKAIISNYFSSLSNDFIKRIFKEEGLKLRQVLAFKTKQISPSLKLEYESLLADKSYYTIENALYKLWVHFPEDRKKYLEKTKDIYGLSNKNVRLLWLTLARITKDYTKEKQANYLNELRNYTSNNYSYEVRQGAFEYLDEIGALSNQNLNDLLEASNHHSWQFKKYARNLIGVLLEKNGYKKRLTKVARELKEKTPYIKTKLLIE